VTSAAGPTRILSLWLQGEAAAPPLVRLNFDRWRRLNPGHAVQVLDQAAVERLLAGTGLAWRDLPPQALSDVVRARLLLAGGIWVDASVFPARPLAEWLPPLLAETGFFAFDRPEADRPLASWFLAASPDHPVLRAWWAEVLRFWSKPRHLLTFGERGVIPPDPTWQVAPEGGAAGDGYPYFWFHYLFGYLLRHDPAVAALWHRCAKVPAGPPHAMQWVLASRPVDADMLRQLAALAPVHKLNWREGGAVDLLAAL
jgi:hypothetical protein